MNIQEQIKQYIQSLPAAKATDMNTLHQHVLKVMPDCKLWYFDGTDDTGKVVSNPQIGYGTQIMTYADGKTKEFYQIGISANTTGISVYIMGINDKLYLPDTYSKRLGKAKVTGYCIKFKALQDIDVHVLEEAMLDGVARTK
jgi:hypothetical protein